MSVVVTQHDVLTACGTGVEACWQGVLAGQPRFSEVQRFSTKAFTAHQAAQVPGLEADAAESLAMQMVRSLLQPLAGRLPVDTLVLLATTTGEVDLLERSVLQADGATEAGNTNSPHAGAMRPSSEGPRQMPASTSPTTSPTSSSPRTERAASSAAASGSRAPSTSGCRRPPTRRSTAS